MNQSVIPITSPSSMIYAGEHFSIALKEVPCSNCYWEANIPHEISIISNTPSILHPERLKEWVFSTTTRGTHSLVFIYRKRCCGKPILQKEYFTITVV